MCGKASDDICRHLRDSYWRMLAAWLGAALILEFRPVTVVALRAMEALSLPGPVAKTVLLSFGTALFFGLISREVWSLKTETEPVAVEIPGALASVR